MTSGFRLGIIVFVARISPLSYESRMMKIEIGGKYIWQSDLDESGNVKSDAKDVKILATDLSEPYPVCYSRDGKAYTCKANGVFLGYSRMDANNLLPYPEPPKYVPFDSINDIPLNSRMRCVGCVQSYIITGYDDDNNVKINDGWYTLNTLLAHFEFSTDCGKTWSKCGKVA